MRDEIRHRFAANLHRATTFVDAYDASSDGQGRRSVRSSDLLRAAVTFLHATLEDTLRSALLWRWPDTLIGLDKVEFDLGDTRQRTVTVEALANRFRGTSVDEVLHSAITAHLNRQSFSHIGDVKDALHRLRLPTELVGAHATRLAAMIARRHSIVHRADRHDVTGSGHHVAASLPRATVHTWLLSVRAFCETVIAHL